MGVAVEVGVGVEVGAGVRDCGYGCSCRRDCGRGCGCALGVMLTDRLVPTADLKVAYGCCCNSNYDL